MSNSKSELPAESIAIIGMGGRFPGAKDIDELWDILRKGVSPITFFSDEELGASGGMPSNPTYPRMVNAGYVLDDIDMFDASFFGISAREAEFMDPQQRLFLECAWQSLESAGYDTATYPGLIAAFGGADQSTYRDHIITELLKDSGESQRFGAAAIGLLIGNGQDYLTTQTSYKLNLRGASLAVQTACSTSLVAICMACQSLLGYQSDIALAGGVSVTVPQKRGYLYQEGGIWSPDGYCRTFDAKASGMVVSSGVGIVVLKRLSEALDDGDYIHAVIMGSAINNDGSLKVGFTAPSVEGQAQVIAMAQAMAGVDAETITYSEAHGTGTQLGDPIEITALTRAFRASTDKKGFCAIGSLKTNVGHMACAAGVGGLIKTVLALKHKQIPASLNFDQPNPKIDFANSPFYVNTTLSEWNTNGVPRRAGVSAFGIGGTNAHVVLEEAPLPEASGQSRPRQLLVLSAKTSTALETATANLVEHFRQEPDLNLADVAYTLQVGRQGFSYRRTVVCQDIDDAVATLQSKNPRRVLTSLQVPTNRPVVFMFPGQGAQYVDMGRELYQVEPTFRKAVDRCSEVLKPHLGIDLRDVLYPSLQGAEAATSQLNQTLIAQPALFVIEYALAQLWLEWGVRPHAMIGHSIGEYVAACLAEVLSLEDALGLVCARGSLMQNQPGGSMLAVPLPQPEVEPLLGEHLSVAAINDPFSCVISGPTEAVDALAKQLAAKGVVCRPLHTSHAFHSEMMDSVLETFTEQASKIEFQAPKIPYISNVTGTWITAEEATDPSYWARHLRGTVRFADGIQKLMQEPEQVLLEVGPGQTLTTSAGRHPDRSGGHVIVPSTRHPQERDSDVAFLLHSLARLWNAGLTVDWSGFYANEVRRRLPLPTYPFEHQRYWIGPALSSSVTSNGAAQATVQDAVVSNGAAQATVQDAVVSNGDAEPVGRDIADWFYIPSWKPAAPSRLHSNGDLDLAKSHWLVFSDAEGLGIQLSKQLEEKGQEVTKVMVGEEFAKLDAHTYAIRPGERDDYEALLKDLRTQTEAPNTIVHLWGVTPEHQPQTATENFEQVQNLGFYSLAFLAQALAKQNLTGSIRLDVVSSQIQAVLGDESLCPAKATVLGSCKVIPQEYPNIRCRSIDLASNDSAGLLDEKLLDNLIAELTVEPFDPIVAYRKGRRWVQTFEPMRLGKVVGEASRLRKGGVYLITGGLGQIALTIAEYLAQNVQAKLVLTGRSAFPERKDWEQWLTDHGQDNLSRQIRRLLKLEELGAEVMVFSADVADRDRMREVIDEVSGCFGEIHGVIHGAANTSVETFLPVSQIDHSGNEQQFRPKVQGLAVLEELFRGQELDFCLLLSSISAGLGGLRLAGYAAANIFLDALANQQNQGNSVPWISVNWDAWDFRQDGQDVYGVTDAILPQEGMEALGRILDRAPRQIVVSTSDLQARFDKWVRLETLRETQPSQQEYVAIHHPRPNLSSQYVAAETETQQTIARVWQDLLGVGPLGIHDNFFELGGHSLLAVQVISRLQEAFRVELSVQMIFDAPIIAELAEIIDRDLQTSEPDDEMTALMLDLVEKLSESEVKERLSQ